MTSSLPDQRHQHRGGTDTSDHRSRDVEKITPRRFGRRHCRHGIKSFRVRAVAKRAVRRFAPPISSPFWRAPRRAGALPGKEAVPARDLLAPLSCERKGDQAAQQFHLLAAL